MKKILSLVAIIFMFSSFSEKPRFNNCYDYAVYSAAMEAVEYGAYENEEAEQEAISWYANECGNSLNNTVDTVFIE